MGVGLGVWLLIGSGRGIGTARWILIGLAAVGGLLPPVAGAIERALRILRHPSAAARTRVTLLVGLLCAVYFAATAMNQGRDLFPKTHDDCSYVIGMRMLAHGRLWMPAPPLPEFFDAFYLLVTPVYCSIYFPGTALLYVPTASLDLGTWVMPALASGAVAALLYRLFSELTDGAGGLLAVITLLSLTWFRVYSVLMTSHVPMLLMGLAAALAWLTWRQRPSLARLIPIGIAMGWGAITRPADALLFTLPIVIAIAMDLRGQRFGRWVATAGALALCMAPFLALQGVFDVGVTGHLLKTPYAWYLERDQPGSAFAAGAPSAALAPQSPLPEKQDFYRNWVAPRLAGHTPGGAARAWASQYLPMVVDTTLPCRLFLVFLFPGLLALTTLPRRALAATLPLFFAVYFFNPIFLEHYAIIAIPAVLLLTLLGARQVAAASGRWRRQLVAGFTLALLVASITGLWEINRFISPRSTAQFDETFPSIYLQYANRDLPQLIQSSSGPAVVLFKYPPGGNYFEEPVYNTDVAWPLDAPIIRAHDLGPQKNKALFAYFAEHQPQRVFWSFDPSRLDMPLQELGPARQLAKP